MTDTAAVLVQSVERVYITRSSLRIMEAEARVHTGGGRIENETGGILIGRRLNERELLIIAAIDGGEQAHRHPVEFEFDVAYSNRRLRDYLLAYPEVDYIGTWHKHPPQYPSFSIGDVQTAQSLFADGDYKIEELVNPIVWIIGDVFVVRYYYMSRAMAREGEQFARLATPVIVTIDDDDSRLASDRPDIVLAQRIEDERRLLVRAGYRVELKRERQGYLMVLAHPQLPNTQIYIGVGADYPRVPPSVVVAQDDEERTLISQDEVDELWASAGGAIYLVDVVPLHEPLHEPAVSIAASDGSSNTTATPQLMLAKDLPSPTKHQRGPTEETALLKLEPTPKKSEIIQEVTLPRPLASKAPQRRQSYALLIGVVVVAVAAVVGTLWFANNTSFSTIGLPNTTPTLAAQELWKQVDAGDTTPARRVELLELLLARNQFNDPQGRRTADRLREARLMLAQRYRQDGNYAKARELLLQIRTDLTDSAMGQRVSDELAQIALAEGAAALKKGDYAAAAAQFKQIGELDPQPAQQYRNSATEGLAAALAGQRRLAQLASAFKAYDTAQQQASWQAALDALQRVSTIVSQAPEGTTYPSSIAQRIDGLDELVARAHLAYAGQLQLQGELDAAEREYAAVAESQAQGVEVATRERAKSARTSISQAKQLWQDFSSQIAASKFEQALMTLDTLAGFEGFTDQARGPLVPADQRLTIADLRTQVGQQLNEQRRQVALQQTRVALQKTQDALPRPTRPPDATKPPEASPALEATPSQAPTPATNTVYRISIAELSAEQLTNYISGQPIPENVNAIVFAPSGLTMQLRRSGALVETFSPDNSPLILMNAGVTWQILVASDPQGGVTTQGGSVTPEAGKYYQVTVEKMS